MNTENNKLFAEFMGMKPHDMNELDGFWTNTIKAHDFDNVMNLKFHSDWNWLMEVVEKIESLQFQNNNDVFKVVIDYGMCIIYNMINDLETIVNVSKSTKIEATYTACVEFIKWYNEQK